MICRFTFSLVLLLFSSVSLGSNVTAINEDGETIVVSPPDQGAQWKLEQTLCVMRQEEEVACGKVTKTGPEGSTVFLAFQKEVLREGDSVEPEQGISLTQAVESLAAIPQKANINTTPDQGEPTADSDEEDSDFENLDDIKLSSRVEIMNYHREIIRNRVNYFGLDDFEGPSEKIPTRFNLQLGLMAMAESGNSLINPAAHLQWASGRTTALGVAVSYVSIAPIDFTAKMAQFTLTTSYYPTGVFSGVTGRLGFGLGYGSRGNEAGESSTGLSYHINGTVGWRWRMGQAFNFGIEAGAEYFHTSMNSGNVSALLPSMIMEMGFCF